MNRYLNIIVNHWSSRREGELRKPNLNALLGASNVVNSIIKKLKKEDSNAKLIGYGRF